ncbi:ArgP/LysG family DNA-binding transcriptional regulator [Paraburkholderia sp. Cy-641]|uniref:HTH-type transcriptional regulator ArgP n=1 Tax=Paraburkholderia sp. Cy-641 TaxID=2608337 RepID=UPI00141E2C87|nr:HTH-type transcriptional regulator ArgP [Paraburkholderia sp. Cy-641]NIF78055.1 ArgP/LysG family DNA-binding transcriptional regulator [Paraburkholderia sp. Cy-641]
MLDRQQLETFATVLEFQHFRKAAAALNISPGAVSQRIKSLEASVGAVLLMREPTIVPTRAGESILRYIMAMRLLEDETLEVIRPGEFPPVNVAIAVNADSLATWFEPVSWQLAMQHIGLEIIADDQDHTLSALARGDVKGCISTQPEPLVGFRADLVGGMRYRCVATPEFVGTYLPRGMALPAILDVPAILFNRKDAIHDTFLSTFFGVDVGRYRKHYFPSSTALLNAVLNGLGYGLVPEMQIGSLLASGVLVDLAPANSVLLDLYWHHWESEPEPLAKISTLIMDHAHRSLVQEVSSS